MYNWRRWRRCAAAWLGAALFVLCETRFVCSFFATDSIDQAPCLSKFNYCFESQVQNDGVATKLRILIAMHFLRLQARARLHKPTATLRSLQLCRGSSPISLSMASVSYVRSFQFQLLDAAGRPAGKTPWIPANWASLASIPYGGAKG